MKRFWKQATYEQRDGGFVILLDGRPMRLPGGDILPLRHAPLAEAIAAEWDVVADVKGAISTADLPLTQLAATALLRIAPDPAPTAAVIARYAESDLLCYRVATPPDLRQRQSEQWQPWLDWAAQRYDALLRVTDSIAYVDQDAGAKSALARAVEAQDADGLTVLGIVVPIFGSLVLGLAVVEGALKAEAAFRISCLDALYQEEKWGVDAEAGRHRTLAERDVLAAARYVALARQPVESMA
jgi:chaperone required for assembly of F1-ATPase